MKLVRGTRKSVETLLPHKTCTKCRENKPLTAFKSRGGKEKHRLKSECRACTKKFRGNVASKKRSDEKRWDRTSATYRAESRALGSAPMTTWLKARRAEKNNKSHGALTLNWVRQWQHVTHCPVAGLPFRLGAPTVNGSPDPMSPSLDRIDPNKGYTDNNTRVVSCFVNFAKNAWSDEQFKLLILTTASNLRH